VLGQELAEPSDGDGLEAQIVLAEHQQAKAQRVLEVDVRTFAGGLARKLQLPSIECAS